MRILVDLLHPAHAHVFRAFHREMEGRGHELLVVSRHKDVTEDLLDAWALPHETIGCAGRGALGLAGEGALRLIRLARIARRLRPDVMIGCMGPVLAPVARALRIPSIVLYNNESAAVANRIAQRWATVYITPASFRTKGLHGVRGRHVAHPAFHEIAYLHPDRFRPDRSALAEAGLDAREPFLVVRFPALVSSHDRGVRGIAAPETLVRALEEFGRVVISSEAPLPPSLASHRLAIAPHRFHDVLAFARLQIGESATLAAEAAVLAVPSLYVASSPRGTLDHLRDDHGLVATPATLEAALVEVRRLLSDPTDRAERIARRDRLLRQTGDFTAWLVDFVDRREWETSNA